RAGIGEDFLGSRYLTVGENQHVPSCAIEEFDGFEKALRELRAAARGYLLKESMSLVAVFAISRKELGPENFGLGIEFNQTEQGLPGQTAEPRLERREGLRQRPPSQRSGAIEENDNPARSVRAGGKTRRGNDRRKASGAIRSPAGKDLRNRFLITRVEHQIPVRDILLRRKQDAAAPGIFALDSQRVGRRSELVEIQLTRYREFKADLVETAGILANAGQDHVSKFVRRQLHLTFSVHHSRFRA